MNYRLAQHVELVKRNGEALLLSKFPLTALRLNGTLAALVERGMNGREISAAPGEVAVLEQLAAKGFVERVSCPITVAPPLPTVSIVIPVKDRAGELQRCLASLAALSYPLEKIQIIVVDDGSSDESPLVARRAGALVVPSGGTGRGPAAARNAGTRRATGELLAFIDSDCIASPGWLDELVPSFADPAMAAVGGRVDGMCLDSAVDRYESAMSSLCLGSRQRTGNSGNDTFYLPSCNLLVRRSAFLAAGGFKDEMHVGEDVDLTWRLRDSGWTIAYLPVGRVNHEHRSTVRSFMSRRFDYGTSEGMLQRIHPQRRKRMVVPPLLALLLALLLLAPFTGGWSLALAAIVLGADALAVRGAMAKHRLPVGMVDILSGRLRAMGSLVYYLSFHLVRYYSPILICAALLVPLLWLLYGILVVCAAGVDFSIKKPPQSFGVFAAIYLLEQIAYGSGVFWGCLSTRCFSSYRVVLMRHMELPTGA